MHALLSILSAFVFSFSASSNDKCLQNCEIVSSVGDIQELRCSCNKSKGKKRNIQILQENLQPYSKIQLKGVSKSSILSLAMPSCSRDWKAPIFDLNSEIDLTEISQVNTMPICECLNYRARFPLQKTCTESQAGEKYCKYSLKTDSPPSIKPTRKLSWLDVQSCEVKKANYRRPASCAESECKSELPNCSKGYELVNIADPGTCCPKYVCKLGGFL